MSASQSISITSASTYASVSPQSGQSLQPFANLNLTEAQRTSLRAILANAKKTGESKADITKQIDALLTPAQQQTLASDLKAGPGSGSGDPQQQSFANLDLTAEQSTALNSILANAKSTGESRADVQKQIDAILTTAQRQTLASEIKAGPPSSTSAPSDPRLGTRPLQIRRRPPPPQPIKRRLPPLPIFKIKPPQRSPRASTRYSPRCFRQTRPRLFFDPGGSFVNMIVAHQGTPAPGAHSVTWTASVLRRPLKRARDRDV